MTQPPLRDAIYGRLASDLQPTPDEKPRFFKSSPVKPDRDLDRNIALSYGVDPDKLAEKIERAKASPREPTTEDGGGFFEVAKRFAGKTLLGGTKWGVVDTPFGVKLINPLKTITSGLNWSQQNITDPIAGYSMGFVATGLSNIGTLDQSRFGKIADQFRIDVLDSNSASWQASAEFNRSRDSFFPGEKFVSSLVYDPLSYVGFGLLGKVPVAGKAILGPMEHGYVEAMNLPFRMAGKGLRKINPVPESLRFSRSQRVRDAAMEADMVYRKVMFDATKKSMDMVGTEEMRETMGRIINPEVAYNSLATNFERRLRDIIFESPVLTETEMLRLWKVVADSPAIPTTEMRFRASEEIDKVLKGELSSSEVSGFIFEMTGRHGRLEDIKTWLDERITRRLGELESSISVASNKIMHRQVVINRYGVARNRLDSQFDQWVEMNGRIGAIVAGFDNVQRKIWAHGIQRWLARPLASSVLKTPGFMIDNLIEDPLRQLLGKSGVGFQDIETFEMNFAGYANKVFGEVSKVQSGVASRAGVIAGKDDLIPSSDLIGIPEYVRALSFGAVNMSDESIRVSKWIFGDSWYEKSNELSNALRRHYLSNRSYQRVAEMVIDRFPELANAISSRPVELSHWAKLIDQAVTLRAGQGRADSIRALADELSVERIKKREARGLADRFVTGNGMTERSRVLLHDWIETGGNKATFDDIIKAVRQNEWNHFMQTAAATTTQINAVLDMLRQLTPGNAKSIEIAYRAVRFAVEDLYDTPSRINRAVTVGIRRGEFGVGAQRNRGLKQKLHDEATVTIEKALEGSGNLVEELVKELRRISNGEIDASAIRNEFFATKNSWESVRMERRALFDKTPAAFRDDDFWQRFEDIGDKYFGSIDASQRRANFSGELDEIGERIRIYLNAPPIKVNGRTIPADEILTPATIGEMVGMQGEELTQSIFLSHLDKNHFVEWAKYKAAKNGFIIEGIGAKSANNRIAKVYEDTLTNIGLTDKLHSAFRHTEEAILSMKDELMREFEAPRFTPEQHQALKEYLERVAKSVEDLDPALTAAAKTPTAPAAPPAAAAPASKAEKAAVDDYRGIHRAPTGEHGEGSLDAMNRTYPDDVYSPDAERFYGDRVNPKLDVKAASIVRKLRGKPNAEVTVYRAVPKGAQAEIQPGDWVTTVKEYAQGHGERFDEGADIIEKNVKAGELFTEGNSLFEFGWNPKQSPAAPSPAAAAAVPTPAPAIATAFTPTPGSGLERLVQRGDEAVNLAVRDFKESFPNYIDSNMLDSFMTAIFPFWTYEAQRLPFLLRAGLSHPAMWENFGPAGQYWDATDDGYVRPNLGIGTEFNLASGTAFGTVRRVFRAEYPPPREAGLAGHYGEVEETLNRFGFYVGSHIKLFQDGLVPMISGNRADVGEFLPGSYVAPLSVLGSIPGPIGERMNRLKTMVIPDRFRERQVLKELWEMGLPAGDVDISTFRPKPGSKVTDDDIKEAMRRAAVKESIETLVGKVRFKGEAEVEFRESVEEIWELAGLPRDQQRQLRKMGVPFTSVLALPPPMARALREIPGTEDYAAANTLLKPEETQRIALRQADMWSEYRNRQDFLSDKQENFNAGWFDGTIAPSVWRRNTQDVQSERGLVLNTLRGRAKNAKGEVVLIDPRAEYAEVPITPEESLAFRRRFNIASPLPLRHPVEELVEAYYSYTPLDIDGDGSPEWNQFFRVRAEFLNLLPDDVRDEVIDVIDRNVSEPERVLRELNRGFLGEYWEIDDKLAEVHGVSRLINEFALARKHGDEETLAAIRRDPRYKRYTREVSAAKERARMSNAQLDYALNIFGFTGETISFKNTTAKSWWASDNRRPNLGRFNTSREIATIGTSIGRAGTTGNADTGNRGIR